MQGLRKPEAFGGRRARGRLLLNAVRANLLRHADGSPGAWGYRGAARVTPQAFSEAASCLSQRGSKNRNGKARRLDEFSQPGATGPKIVRGTGPSNKAACDWGMIPR